MTDSVAPSVPPIALEAGLARLLAAGQYHYAMALLAGRGTPQDPAAAQAWLAKAAEQGDRDAARVLQDAAYWRR